ncbi:MAG: protease inhibitor I42 family protein, partial [Lentisphaeria bacterium]|nr:protease inhibitor I42 family protein [Lentisphaeria bacterium]
GDLYQADSGASGALPVAGQGGTHYFAYRVIGPGICGIALEYKRSWENAAPARTFEIMIKATGTPEEAASDPRELPPDEAPVPMTDSKGNVTYRNQL